MDLTLTIAVIGIILSIFIPLAGYYYKKNRELKIYYSLIWKNVSKLTPKDFLGERPYGDTYFERNVDTFLCDSVKSKSNVLIVGPPLSGKTRAVYNSLKEHRKNSDILATRSIGMSSFEFPYDYKFWREKIIFIDDLQKYIEKQDKYPLLFKTASEKKIPVIATCHSGREYITAKNKLIEHNIDIEMIFGDNIYEINKVSIDEAKVFADKLGVKWDNIKFNGTIGSIFMKLSEMERRYDQCDTIEKTILRILRTLYLCGVYEDDCIFKIEWLKKLASKYELPGKDFEWIGWLKNLEGKEFIQLSKRDKVWAEDAYLEYIIKPEAEITDRELFEDVIGIFQNDIDVLQMAGERAFDTGSTSVNVSSYMRLAISAFEKVLKQINLPGDSQAFIKANYYLGMSYWSLSRVEKTNENALKAIGYYNDILNNTEINLRPEDYAMIKSRTGSAFTVLADTENRIENCKTAIECFKAALKIYSLKDYPAEYALTTSNLGGVYLVLSNGENSAKHLITAAQCFEESLKIRTLSGDSKGYAYTKNNLGNTFARLSQLEEPEKNLFHALEAYTEAMKIYEKKNYSLLYGIAVNNIGNVYCLMAHVKDKKQNAMKAKEWYEKALEVRTIENAPVQFSNTMFNLGDAYMILYEAEENTEYLYKAMECFNEALNLDLSNIFLFRVGEIYAGLGKSYMLLALKEESQANLNKGLELYEKALKIFSGQDIPEMYNKVMEEYKELKSKFNL